MSHKIAILACEVELVANPDGVKCDLCKKPLRIGDVIRATITNDDAIDGQATKIERWFCGGVCYRTWDAICDARARTRPSLVAIIDGGIPSDWKE